MDKRNRYLVPLDLVMDYPVNWEFWRILRDLIQNFYDSIGYENFHKEFDYNHTVDKTGNITLTMKTKNHPFSYEWLTYFGGSTKTGQEGYVGNYGEGFKLCALCLVRMGCDFIMESQNWKLRPQVYTKKIDGQNTRMLGYQVEEREDDGETCLVVTGIDKSRERIIQEGLLEFFYQGNPLFGRCLADTEDYAVYERSEMRIPSAWWEKDYGLLYYRYLARGTLPFRLVVLAKTQKYDSEKRDRNTMYGFEIPSLIYKVACTMTPTDSYEMLRHMKNHWAEMPVMTSRWPLDLNTWYYVVCQLVRNMAMDDGIRERFVKDYPALLYMERTGSDPAQNRKIRQAKEWHRSSGKKEQLVNPIFRLLGVPSLLETYREHVEQTVFSVPDAKQERMDAILEAAYETVVQANLGQDEMPPKIVIGNDDSRNPMEFCSREYGQKRKRGRISRKYRVENILLKPEDYSEDCFPETFIKYCKGRFRAFGTDRSERMTVLLTYLGSWMYENWKELKKAEKRWKEAADATD